MPNSLYVPGNEPPSRGDLFLRHGMLVSLGLTSFLTGCLLLFSLHREIVVSRALEGLNGWALVLLTAVLFCGFALLIGGAMFPKCSWSDIDVLKPLTVACFLLGAAWFAFSISVIFSGNPYAMITITLAMGYGWGFGLNGVALAVSWARLERRKKVDRAQEGQH